MIAQGELLMNLALLKKELLKSREEINARLERTHKHIYQKDEPVSANFNEQIKQTESDQLVHALEIEGKEELKLINRALQRLEAGDYNRCGECGGEIGEKRLNAIPYAELCIKCASAK
jgi:DnaK suppressor protein